MRFNSAFKGLNSLFIIMVHRKWQTYTQNARRT